MQEKHGCAALERPAPTVSPCAVAELTSARARGRVGERGTGRAAATAEGAGADDARALTKALSILQAHHVQALRYALHDGQ